MKIQIIGYSGSGKSTLAKSLAKHYSLDVLYLDSVQFYGDWQARSKEEQKEIVKQFLESHSNGWIIDGNYSDICPERFEQCDKVIFLNYNRFYCYQQAKKRYRKNKGQRRESCPCIEKFDFEFRKWILWNGRVRKIKNKLLACFHKCQGEKLMFKNRKRLNKYLKDNQIDLII